MYDRRGTSAVSRNRYWIGGDRQNTVLAEITARLLYFFYILYSEAICDPNTLPTWTGYDKTIPSVILSGQTIGYTCSGAQSMIPVGEEAWDPESDGSIDVTCIDGAFEQPKDGTPPPCVTSTNIECNSRPEPPANTELEYQNIKPKYRPGEHAYYVCKNN